MNISGLQYNLNRKTLEIYLSGCRGKCPGCHNEELWDFSCGKDYKESLDKIEKRIKTGLVDEIWILGGDPLDQDKNELCDLINQLRNFDSNIKIWIWTRYPVEKIDNCILNKIHYLKTGEYIQNDRSYIDSETGIELASSNQKIVKFF